MTKVYSNAIDKTIVVERVIAEVKGHQEGPTMVFFAGIHGNETAGVFALETVLKSLNPKTINGTVYGISGNLSALKNNQRYIEQDLNRLWTRSQLENLLHRDDYTIEEKEQLELFRLLKQIINFNSGPFYFIDFHTTSSKTLPFITINDALINRKFSGLFPVPVVLGIEEYLNGPLLSYINELGYVSLGFESGQHDEKEAINNCKSFIYLALVHTKIMSKEQVIGFKAHYAILKSNANALSKIFEVVYLHQIKENDMFEMKEGFQSFQSINKGITLATCNSKEIKSTHNARLFMPLYQNKGAEGYFIIKPINPFFLGLSASLRHLKFDGVLVLFPGISWINSKKEGLKVNLKVAKFLAKSIFHLLGYRNKKVSANHMLLYNRERNSKTESYKSESWY